MVDAPGSTKRSFPEQATFGFRARVNKPTPPVTLPDAVVRANILSLSHQDLQSATIRLIQFNPAAKAHLSTLVSSIHTPPPPTTTLTLDDETVRSKYFGKNIENCKYWLSDKWYAQHPSLPQGYACQVSRTAVRKEVSEIMKKAKPEDFKLGRAHDQCYILLDAIVALIDIAIDILGREGIPSGRCRSDRSLAEHIGDQLGDLIYRTSVYGGDGVYAHEDCMWEHILVASEPTHPARRAIGQMVRLPPSPSHADLYIYRSLAPALREVAEAVVYFCRTGIKRTEDDMVPDIGDISLSVSSDSDGSDSEEEVIRPSKRR